MKFEWDENKNLSNIKKHGVDFNDALTVFDDTYKVEVIDNRQDYGEERIQVIGEVKAGILMVVYTWRSNETSHRLISARKANQRERALYNSYK